MQLSVIICTHNPRFDYLGRTLNALRLQSLPKDQWELVLVDNASNPALADTLDLAWHPRSRVISESELGILPARVRGLKETETPFILFVDDDNLLAPDYLEQALAIAETHPFLGVWGGSIQPEFEVSPPPWIDDFRQLLACVEVQEDCWSNLKFIQATIPPTAGMCLRRVVAKAFTQVVSEDPRRHLLGRRGKTGLTNGEDADLALTACDIGLGMGQFARLKLTHLIPANRLDEDYLVRLDEGTRFTGMLLDTLRGHPPTPYRATLVRAWLGRMRRWIFWSRRQRKLFEGGLRARQRACQTIAGWR